MIVRRAPRKQQKKGVSIAQEDADTEIVEFSDDQALIAYNAQNTVVEDADEN